MVPKESGPLRVCAVAHYYPPHVGGLEVVAQRAATGLARRGHDVTVVTSACPGRPGESEEEGVRVRRVRAGNWWEGRGIPFPVFGLSLPWHLWRVIRRSDVVQVHDMLYLSSWAAALLCRLTATPYVVSQHVSTVEHPARLVRWVQAAVLRTVGSLVLRGATVVLPISPVIESWTHAQVAGVRTRVLRNGVDRDRFRPARPGERAEIRRRFGLPGDALLVLFVGRFVPKKGFDVVSAATGDGHHLVFVGGQRPPGLPESPGRTFLGALASDDTAALYRACDVFVCASVGEGPMTAMEALVSGCAVVVNDDPAMHALGLGSGAEVVPMSPDRLRTCLQGLASDRNAVRTLSERGLRVARTLPTWDDYLDTLESVLSSAVRARVAHGDGVS